MAWALLTGTARMTIRSQITKPGLWLALALAGHGCFIVDAEDRRDCDDALDILCACASRPCNQPRPPQIVTALQRCNSEDVRPSDQEGNVHLCVKDVGHAICDILDGLAAKDGSLCQSSCDLERTCFVPLERECQRYQYETCDVPDAGAADAPLAETR
jgi:hypothetical protein